METGRGLVGPAIDLVVIDQEVVTAPVSGTDPESEIGQASGTDPESAIARVYGIDLISTGRRIGTSTGRLFDRIGRTVVGTTANGGVGMIRGTAVGIVAVGR
jgi:hypothetical protein